MEGIRIQKYIFVAIFTLLSLLLIFIFSPFFSTMLWSLLFYILINPFYLKILRKIPRGRAYGSLKNILAALFSLLTVFLIVLPFFFIAKEAIRQSFQVMRILETMVRKHNDILSFKPDDPVVVFVKEITFNSFDLSTFNISKQILSLLRESTNTLITASTFLLKNLTSFILTLCFMVFTLFFLLVDGEYLLGLFMRAVPMNTRYLRVFIGKFRDTVRHLVNGYFLVALYQASAAFLLFFVFNVPGYLLLSLVLFFFAFIPMIGAAGIWIPVAAVKLLSGEMGAAVALALLCGFFVSTVDNFLRPLVLRDMIKIHPLLIFFSILGAVKFFGFQGIILGPLIIIFFFAALEIFIDLYQIKQEEDTNDKTLSA